MLSFKLDTNDLDEYLIRTQRSLQKTLRRAINRGIKRAHTEGYKILREKLKVEKPEKPIFKDINDKEYQLYYFTDGRLEIISIDRWDVYKKKV